MTLDDRVVLVRHRKGDAVYHLLPGGGVRFGETLEHALVREVAEETGLVCEVVRPLLINDTIAPDGSRHVVNITLACHILGGSVTRVPDDPRVEAVDLFPPEGLAHLDLRPPVADELVDALSHPDDFVASYVGPVFTPEQYEPDNGGGNLEP
jgi:ADP-ribose pyrophosphatase YjhB (NUDIX family)